MTNITIRGWVVMHTLSFFTIVALVNSNSPASLNPNNTLRNGFT
jgi:hypothetical protein